MDRVLRRLGFWPVFIAFWLLGYVAGREPHALWQGFASLASVVLFVLAIRTAGLEQPLRPSGWRAAPRRFLVRFRWPLTIAYGAAGGWYAHAHVDVARFTVVYALVAGAAMAVAARPLPRVAREP